MEHKLPFQWRMPHEDLELEEEQHTPQRKKEAEIMSSMPSSIGGKIVGGTSIPVSQGRSRKGRL